MNSCTASYVIHILLILVWRVLLQTLLRSFCITTDWCTYIDIKISTLEILKDIQKLQSILLPKPNPPHEAEVHQQYRILPLLSKWFALHPPFCKSIHCCFLSPRDGVVPDVMVLIVLQLFSAYLCLLLKGIVNLTYLVVMGTMFLVFLLLLGRITWTWKPRWKHSL